MHFTAQPILRDFDQFLDYLGQPGQIELTKDKGYLRTADLHRLNDRMHFRLAIFNPKSQQPAFPLLNTFLHIARTAQLFWVKRDKKCLLSVAEDRVRQYDALSADEKYFFLLESFWCFVDWDEAYDSRSFGDTLFYLALSQMPVGKTVSIADHDLKRKGEIDGPMTTFMAEVFQAFGFFDLTWDAQLSERPMKYQFPYQSAALS